MKQFLTTTAERLFNGFLYAKGILSQQTAGEGKIMLVVGSVMIALGIVGVFMGIRFIKKWKLDVPDRLVTWATVGIFWFGGVVLFCWGLRYVMYSEAYAIRDLISLIIRGR